MKILSIHDLAGFGRCSLTTIIAVFASKGHQCVPAPTAVFSTHTAFEDFIVQDLSQNLDKYIDHYKKLDLKFDAIYSGFLSSKEQIDSVIFACEKFENAKVIIDPVMGDSGKIYKTYTKEMCNKMKELIKHADIITPNITELKILLDIPLDYKIQTEQEIFDCCKKLATDKIIIITGIHLKENFVSTAFFENGELKFYHNKYIDAYFPGTGDLFTSLLISNILNGDNIEKSVEKSSNFVLSAIENTIKKKTNPLFGVEFEELL